MIANRAGTLVSTKTIDAPTMQTYVTVLHTFINVYIQRSADLLTDTRKCQEAPMAFQYENFLHDIIEGKMVCRKRMELLHDIMEGRERFNLRQIKMETE